MNQTPSRSFRISQESIDIIKGIPIIDLASAMGDPLTREGKQYQIPCPDLNHTEKVSTNAYIEPNKNLFKCFSCGIGGNSAIAYYAYKTFGHYEPKKHFVPSVKGIAEIMGVPLKMEDGSVVGRDSGKTIRKFVPQKELEARSPEELDAVYRAFLSLCPIYDHHLAEWRNQRRYTDEQINLVGLRSIPTKDMWVSMYEKLHAAGISLERVPGFSQSFMPDFYETVFPEHLGEKADLKDDEGKTFSGFWYYLPSSMSQVGYYIPVRDENGYIIRLRIRRDNGDPKYIWFSSQHNIDTESNVLKKRKNGVGSGGPLNIAVPFSLLKNWPKGEHLTNVCHTKTLIVTEGEFKSQISANTFNVPVAGTAGLGNFRDLIPLIKEWGVEKLIIAADMDTLQKEDDTLKAEKKVANLFELLRNLSIEVAKTGASTCIWTWGLQDGKGLDDLVYNRKLPVEINLSNRTRHAVTFDNVHTI